MAKLSKEAAKKHQQALDLVHSDKVLSLDDRFFILENFHEAATNMNGLAGAFFTPEGLANDFSIEVSSCKSLIDLCAGIGRLSFHCRDRAERIVCVEQNPEYAAVGKRVLPEAEWIVSDIFSLPDLGRFSMAISNPPFGAVKTGGAFKGLYSGASFEYKVIELASHIADRGAFIIPQSSAPFRYSGERAYREEITKECAKMMRQTGIVLENNCGIDTSYYKDEWHGVSPICEIVLCEFDRKEAIAAPALATEPVPVVEPVETAVSVIEAEVHDDIKQPVPVATTEPARPVKSEQPTATVIETKAPARPVRKTVPQTSITQLSLFDAA